MIKIRRFKGYKDVRIDMQINRLELKGPWDSPGKNTGLPLPSPCTQDNRYQFIRGIE